MDIKNGDWNVVFNKICNKLLVFLKYISLNKIRQTQNNIVKRRSKKRKLTLMVTVIIEFNLL